MLDQKVAMQPNVRFIAYGAIIAVVYMTIASSLDGINRLVVVCSLVAIFALMKKRAEALSSAALLHCRWSMEL
jgi:hypothetical protein